MTITVGLRELGRNSNILEGYDYVDVEDKKHMNTKAYLYLQNMQLNLKNF